MNKKRIVTFTSIVIVIVAVYLFLESRNKEQDLVSKTTIQNYQNAAILDRSEEGPYGEKYQQELFIQLEGREKLPRFEDFPATEFSNNKNITVDINSDPVGRMYRTALRYSVGIVGINFAGKYSVVEWGCGSGCQDGAIVDADTGHVYPVPGPMVSGFEARKNSRLLIQNPLIMHGNWREWYRMCYWEWTGNKFKLLGGYRVDFDKKKIVEVSDGHAFCSN